ncbi:MAG: M3 family metallopeptidase [Myxococcales bacterium]|nr:M3 family metallopeptidase [Myxococcales bacterium]
MSNPLLELGEEIPFDRIEAEHVRPAIRALIRQAEAAIAAIGAAKAPRTYANTLGALEAATDALELAITVVGHLESVATTPALREAYSEVRPEVSALFSGIPLDDALWVALRAFAETAEAASLEPTRRRFLDKTLDEFRRHGAGLAAEGKARLQAIDVQLSKLTTRFAQNVLDATNAFELLIEEEAALAGLPESARRLARASAEEKGLPGWRFTLHAPSVMAVLTYLDDAGIRERIWRAFGERATESGRDNRPIVEEILALRQEKAELLGYADFADLVLEDRMARSGAAAQAFIEDLRDRTEIAFRAENAALEAFRAALSEEAGGADGEDDGEDVPTLRPWDVSYYAEKQRLAQTRFDEEELRPYFEAQRTLSGLFAIAERLYGIEIVERDRPVWDPAVRAFELREGGARLAIFYADLFPRENKRGGAWMCPLRSAVHPSGEIGTHLGLFCANLTPPSPGAPSLLTLREVETLFHEFGHLLHHALSRVPVRSLSGSSVAWDFVELPSQIMENWCWEREALDLFARHHQLDEPIPEALLERMRGARTFRAANDQMRQLAFATLDLRLHRGYEAARDGDAMTVARQILQAHAPTRLPESYAMLASFTHLFGSPTGYAGGYYSYKWAEVLDADAFTRFRLEGLLDPAVGRAFREQVLARGDSRDPMALYIDFMGREPRLDALLERAGLAASTD